MKIVEIKMSFFVLFFVLYLFLLFVVWCEHDHKS